MNSKVKHVIHILIPALSAVVVLLLGALLPQILFARQQKHVIGEKVSVSASSVHPYGEDYDNRIERLKTTIYNYMYNEKMRFLIYVFEFDKEQQNAFYKGYGNLLAFYNGIYPGLWEQISPNDSEFHYIQTTEKQDASTIGIVDCYDEIYGSLSEIVFDTESGIPFSSNITFLYDRIYDNGYAYNVVMDPESLWMFVMDTYSEALGDTFVDEEYADYAPSKGNDTDIEVFDYASYQFYAHNLTGDLQLIMEVNYLSDSAQIAVTLTNIS